MAKNSSRAIDRRKPDKRKDKNELEQVFAKQLEPVVTQGIQLGFALLTSFLTKKLMRAEPEIRLDSRPHPNKLGVP